MKNRYSFHLLLFILLLVSASEKKVFSQVKLDCESGNRGIEQGNCWGFGAVSYSRRDTHIITGFWSALSNQLSSTSPENCWIKTPWMMVGSGNITFKAKFDANNGNSRGFQLYYIPYNSSNSPYFEGTPVLFYTYTWPLPYPTGTAKLFSIPIPGEIANSVVVYKIKMSMVGSGGNSRLISDDFEFPGTYWSDPANACGPKVMIQDKDNDGVADAQDNYPDDPNRAYNMYYPSLNKYGTLAFEDSWPFTTDYDMNDVVINYRFNTVTNAKNNVVEIIGTLVTRASGATYKNAFGFQLDGISPDKIVSVAGNNINPGSIFNFGSNGLETGQTFANCIVFDNFYKLMTHPGSGTGINTTKTAPFVPYDTLTVKLVFIDKGQPAPGGVVSINELTSNIINFYIVANQHRDLEIHLPDRKPSSLANTSLFGTGLDDTQPASGKYYKTSNNLPWGINIVQGFEYPIEKSPINEAYLHFIDWAVSSGSSYPDWYLDKPEYRDPSKIY
jgi:LruC domain-containing protein